jgi:hypothetical protein
VDLDHMLAFIQDGYSYIINGLMFLMFYYESVALDITANIYLITGWQ